MSFSETCVLLHREVWNAKVIFFKNFVFVNCDIADVAENVCRLQNKLQH